MTEPYHTLGDEDLIARARAADPETARALLAVLYERHYRTVARWCLRVTGDPDTAADVAQDVFVRVHERLGSFRGDSRFTTWLYQVTRSVAINRGIEQSRRRGLFVNEEDAPEATAGDTDVESALARAEIGRQLHEAIDRDLDPLEARVLLLHHVHGWTLATITRRLGLQNRSGAKAYLVAARRKLQRRFGRWLRAQSRSRRWA